MNSREKLLNLFRRRGGLVQASEVRAIGVHHRWLARLVADGTIERPRQGLYRLPDAFPGSSLVEAARCVPHGVVCLLSALSYHDLTTFNPPEVPLAVERGRGTTRNETLPLHIVIFSARTFRPGIEEVSVDGHKVRLYGAEKTICDCFRYRHKIGMDVALEGLRNYLRRRDRDLDRLLKLAEVCRVRRVMTPYLEAMV